ncbi:MAG TPA: GNAT family N-acetyltransferase, partial [Chloroflexia bacterium]|nr:GNAT family N-acetyltransferase [Chloroflexia bacterium]
MLDDYPKEFELRDGQNAIVRVATREDEVQLVLFFLSIPEDQRDFVPYDLTDQENLQGWFAGPNWEEAFPLVAEVNGHIAAVSLLKGYRAPWCHHIGECWMIVQEDSRGLGLGRLMASEACSLANDLAIEKLKAEVRADDSGAIKILKQLGFKLSGSLSDYIKDKEGQTHDV